VTIYDPVNQTIWLCFGTGGGPVNKYSHAKENQQLYFMMIPFKGWKKIF